MGHAAKSLDLGWPPLRSLHDYGQNAIEIPTNVGIGESQYTIAHPSEHKVPIRILPGIMGIAIYLYHEAQVAAYKVTDKAAERDLAREFQTLQLGAA